MNGVDNMSNVESVSSKILLDMADVYIYNDKIIKNRLFGSKGDLISLFSNDRFFSRRVIFENETDILILTNKEYVSMFLDYINSQFNNGLTFCGKNVRIKVFDRHGNIEFRRSVI